MAKASIAICSIIWHAAAKAGVEIFTQHFAAQVGPYRIRANCIAPETIPTQRNKRRIPEPRQSALCELHALRRLGTSDDAAFAALYLASDHAPWVAGVIFDAAGGAVTV